MVTAGEAADFRTLSENSVRGFVKRAKHFFAVAIEHELIAKNPFAKVASTVKANPKRFYFVSREEAAAVLDACGSTQWRLIFAMARFGGLRCPSEVMSLRWGDIDWERRRIRVRSPKTEKHEDGDSRVIPLFPELEPILREAFEDAVEGQGFVVTHMREERTTTSSGSRVWTDSIRRRNTRATVGASRSFIASPRSGGGLRTKSFCLERSRSA